jgi:MFS family permease
MGRIWLLYIAAFGVGAAETVFGNAAQSILPGQLAMSTLVLFAVRELRVGARGYGVMLGGAVGGVVGGLVARRVVARLGTRGAVIAAATIGTSSVLVVGLFVRNPYLMPVCIAASWFSATVWNVATVSLRQRIIPDRLRGRVNSAYRLAGWGSMPIGAAVGGVIAAAWGLRAPWLVAGTIRLAVLATAIVALPASLFAAAEAGAAVPTMIGTTSRN